MYELEYSLSSHTIATPLSPCGNRKTTNVHRPPAHMLEPNRTYFELVPPPILSGLSCASSMTSASHRACWKQLRIRMLYYKRKN